MTSLVTGFPTANMRELPSPATLQARVLMAFAPTERDYGRTVSAIRQQPGLFLKPVLIICGKSSTRWKSCIDSEIAIPPSPSAVTEALHTLQDIGRRVNEFRSLEKHTRERRLRELLLLRYLASRTDASVRPVPSASCTRCYRYPLADALTRGTATSGGQLLEDLREAGLLRGQVVDRIRVCPGCGDFRLNLRQRCPHCDSLVSVDDSVLPHFPCSHSGTDSELGLGNDLERPDGESRARERQVDYERRPSHFRCQSCHEVFSKPHVQCRCLNCRKTVSAANAETRLFRRYELTRSGRLTAEAGAYPETHVADLLRNDPGLYHLGVFKQLYHLEIARCRRYDVPTTLALLSLENLSELVAETHGERTRRLTSELKKMLADTFRKTDLLGNVSRNRVLVMFTHTTPRKARNALQRLCRKLRKLAERPVTISMELFDLRREAPALDQFRPRQK